MAKVDFGVELHETLPGALAFERALERGLTHISRRAWPVHGRDPDDQPFVAVASHTNTFESHHLAEVGEGLAFFVIDRSGQLRVAAFGNSAAAAGEVIAAVREALPPAENPDAAKIPVTFWTYSPSGPRSTVRNLDAPSWQEIVPNYAAGSLADLGKLFAPEFQPGHGGQFVLWHGEPGTGKTTALRALAREWRSWCRFHYIADPDQFFGHHADYMLDVLIREEYEEDKAATEEDAAPRERWRVLILEDTAELLYADAKREVGQALSRFLNCVDGMIGQGLRVLVLVTTNEPLGKLHAAVTRPGRSALTVEFAPLSPREATDWLAAHGLARGAPEKRILADLYAEVEGFEQRASAQRVGFQAASSSGTPAASR